MPWVLDGNNLAGGRDRGAVRRAALAVARGERVRLLVFFDGQPPAGSPEAERLGPVEVRYVPNADAAILAHLGGGGAGWIVATDDAALAARARTAGARAVSASEFWRKAEAARTVTDGTRPAPSLDGELAYFRDPTQRLPEAPERIVPRTRRRR